MGKTLKEKLLDLKKDVEITTVAVMNNGETFEDSYGFLKRMTDKFNLEKPEVIEEYIYKAAETYSRHYDYDTLVHHLILGLVFNKEDIENNNIKEGAKPLNNIVRYYTGDTDSLLNDEKTNDIEYYHFGCGRQGYIKYNELVKEIEQDGLEFNGPKTFEEFKQAILLRQPFDISIVADLKEEKTLEKTL